ncbi:MAG: MaoC family dehydratase N-terminal domain-containing protein [Actinomycetes bacterium]
MSLPEFDRIEVGDVVGPFVRTTDLAHWNRYAAVNDEFIPIHMDDADARAVGQPAAFGMGNLRIAYLHNALEAWAGEAGGIVEFACQFRGLNFKGDTLAAAATVTGTEVRDGARLVHVALSVVNQDGVDTTPGTATVHLWGDAPSVLAEPEPAVATGDAAPGVHLTQAEIDQIGATTAPITGWAVDANDIRKWAIATHWPDPPPPAFVDETVAAAGPWGGLVAPRDLDPFAWGPRRPWGGPWLRGMGAEPGQRVLNGGQRSLYFAPIRPGDVITGVCRLVDVVEKDMKLGPTSVFTTEQRWTNQHGDLVRLGFMTSLYY